MSRASEKIMLDVKADNVDFGKSAPAWERLCDVHATIGGRTEKTGRLVRSGDQMQSVFDEEITIRYHEPTHRAWQAKRTLRITDTLGDVYGVKSVNVIKGRVWWLKMGCVRI